MHDFVYNKKGVLIFANQSTSTTQAYIDNMFNVTGTSTTGSSTILSPALAVSHPILNGPFGNIDPGSFLGGDVNDNIYVSSAPPPGAVSLATKQGNTSHIFSMVNNTLGFVWMGDGGFMAGERGNTSTTIYPCAIDPSGIPITKPYSGGPVYNAIWYGNTLAWAIEYVHANTNTGYMIP